LRTLKALNYKTTYVRNFTDIDDKLLKKAEQTLGDQNLYPQVAQKFEKSFDEEMKALNCIKPTIEPKVTQNIEEIIDFVSELINKKHAYVIGNDVYFDISTFPKYGALSGRDLKDLLAGARVEVNENKKNPADFALWKGNSENLFWKSPWGYGRPGWHIECSALAKKYLGNQIDIHGGGMDLIFPHHENEIAQSESLTSCPFAKYWVHNAFVNINKEKMSKSLGNFLTLKDIFEKYDPMVLRFYYLQHHYRNPLDFSFEDLDAAKRAYLKIVEHFQTIKAAEHLDLNNPIVHELISALADDLNTPKLLGIFFENLPKISANQLLAAQVKRFFIDCLGLTLNPIKEEKKEITPQIEALIAQRELARAAKDWKKSDEIRDQLLKLGYLIQDKKIS
jgi:cysteinyl-tRNA synthetase